MALWSLFSKPRTIRHLKEQIAWFSRQLFGKKSERVVDANQEQLTFDGFEGTSQKPAETQTIPAHERKKRTSTGKDTIKLPEDLPVETIVIDIPEEEKVCKETGLPLQKIGEEVSHKLAYHPASYYLKRIIRPKYAHPKQEEKGILIAPMPDSLLPKCRADESLLADIITCKFVDHLPLYRIAEGFSRDGIVITRRLLSQWVVAAGIALRPLYDAMKERILQSDRLHIDESPVNITEHMRHTSAKTATSGVPAGRISGVSFLRRKQEISLSLTQTCRALNINPRTYLEDVCRRIMGHSANKLHELLPDEWLKAQAAHKEIPPF